jgi:hypothetical protein
MELEHTTPALLQANIVHVLDQTFTVISDRTAAVDLSVW